MNTQTLDYQLQLFGPGIGDIVRIPAEAKGIADKLLCEAQEAGIMGRMITGFDEYISVPGIHAVALEYGQREVPLALAYDMVVLGVAEVIANSDPQYRDLLSDIVNASRVVCDNTTRDNFN